MKPVVALVLTVACTHAAAQPDRAFLARTGAEDLKKSFLACDRSARDGLLDGGEAAACSMVYEELKERVFGGDFQALLAWWKTQTRQAPMRAAAAGD